MSSSMVLVVRSAFVHYRREARSQDCLHGHSLTPSHGNKTIWKVKRVALADRKTGELSLGRPAQNIVTQLFCEIGEKIYGQSGTCSPPHFTDTFPHNSVISPA